MSQLTTTSPETESIARFQSLQSGQYWRAQEAVPSEGIELDEVLLIESLRWVDDAPHTVILRAHPSKYDTSVAVVYTLENGTVRNSNKTVTEHRFLLHDFLNKFAYEPDHQLVRAQELQQIQGKIGTLQEELMEAQRDPAILAAVVEDGLKDQADAAKNASAESEPAVQPHVSGAPALPAPVRTAQELGSMASGTVSNVIGSGITVEGIAQLKSAANREYQVATIKAQWIQGKTSEIAATITAMTPFYKEQAAAALAQTEDTRSYVAKLLKGIESLDLYVLKDVEVTTVREGVSAPKDVPLTFVQKKLVVEYELAVHMDLNEWFDFEKIDLFFDTLRKNDAIVNQIFPTERCVVVMAMTHRDIDYGNGYTNAIRNEANRRVFMMVRDGTNIYQVCSPIETHLKTARLFPSKDDQDRVFRGVFGEHIKFEDVAYTDRLNAHDQFALHYKRFLLLACGLDHQLNLFGEFYEGPKSFHFVSMDFQEKYCRFLHDDDGSNMLPAEQRQSLNDWIAEKNSYLRSGSRVLCKWNELMNPDTAPGACKAEHSRHSGFERRYTTANNLDFVVAYKSGDSVCVDIKVSGYSYSNHADRSFNCKVNLTAFKESRYEHVDLPYLCLDAVTPEELQWYVHNRETRAYHLSYIRFFKEALRFIERERADEHDTRERLVQALAVGGIAEGEEAAEIIQQAVIAWRAANRGKPLPAFQNGAAPAAWTSLLDQMFMLAGEGKRRVDDVAAFVTALGYMPLRLVLSGGAKLVIYAAPSSAERDDRLEEHAWVHRITVEKGKTKYVEKNRRWVLLPKLAASETTLHQWDEAAAWAGLNPAFENFERKQKLLDLPARFAERLTPYAEQMDRATFSSVFEDWRSLRSDMLSKSKWIKNPEFAIPFGVVFHTKSRILTYLCVGTPNAHALLRDRAPDDESRSTLERSFTRTYGKEEAGRRAFNLPFSWKLMEVSIELMGSEPVSGPFFDPASINSRESHGQPPCNPLLADWLDGRKSAAVQDAERYSTATKFWFADGALNDSGRLTLDAILHIELPSDFEPVAYRHITLRPAPDEEIGLYAEWFDIYRENEEDIASNRTAFSSGTDRAKQLIKESTPAGAFDYSTGYSSQSFNAANPAEARVSIQSAVISEHGHSHHAVASTDLADAPQPPAGVERWYVVSANS
ncbi:hypothetical protein RCH14_004485 [Massilia sp. MP_M2]|uniref:hypothetical protein n=1 Tax=Massilia sp. MP_M2 TaxID=3071713 RepID=UPI00319DB04C